MGYLENRRAAVLLVGAGGLGSAAALVLARATAHIRMLRIVDDDRVQISNLHRQVIHATARTGENKTRSAAIALELLAPSIRVEAIEARFTAANATSLLEGIDVVIDGTDTFESKFLINDSCVRARLPFVHAAAVRWQGQLLAVNPRRQSASQPCYRCLFEAPPPRAPGLTCGEAGVVGPVVGVVGALAAEAAIALLEGRAEAGSLHVYDGLAGTSRIVRFRANPECTACGPSRRAPLDSDAFEVTSC